MNHRWGNNLTDNGVEGMEEYLFSINLQLFAEEDKTEEATPRRKEEARKKGQVTRSNELNAAVNLMSLLILFMFCSDFIFERSFLMVRNFYADFLTMPVKEGQITGLLLRFMGEFFIIMAPIFGTALVAGLAVNYFQVGFIASSDTLQMKFERLNPLEGFKRIMSRKALVELLKGIFKICVIGYLTYSFILGEIENLLEILYLGVDGSFAVISSLIISLGMRVGLVFICLAVLDYIYQRYEFQKSLKMSKQEVKEEYRQMEGDPQLKAKIKEKQRQVIMNRMMQEVPRSTVVITNPTELAVALKYNQDEHQAPVVAAKGAGFIAQKIKETAGKNNVPIIENKPVARMLYSQAEIGEEIPVELYQAVAEILAVVLKLKK
ncbi:MAG: flagellar biosynthesis protein FlhB [Firmicutes bacterium HGW-Firmicutes-13]|nr:MAG: flagellar biosynthesis protein FlhB [Firmicutes bacterium HGW-Firmicutes-13]